MPRASLALVALFTIGCISVLGYSCATRIHPARAESDGKFLTRSRAERAADAGRPAADAAPSSQRSEPGTKQASSVARSQASSSQTIPADTVAKWIAEATGDDSKARAAAIVALARAPRLQAVPVLEKVLSVGEPHVDRPLALRSLRELALHQGDADGGIRDVLRHAIYHGDDEAAAQGAQVALDDVERNLGQTAPNASP
jgi:hypothetical protein